MKPYQVTVNINYYDYDSKASLLLKILFSVTHQLIPLDQITSTQIS